MKANGSTIVAIRYPEGTQPKSKFNGSPARNCVPHMDVELADGTKALTAKGMVEAKEAFKRR